MAPAAPRLKWKNENPEETDQQVRKRGIGDVLHQTHEMVEGREQKTSIQTRLQSGDLSKLPKDQVEAMVGEVRPGPAGGWISVEELPPSHSEVGKDHPPFKKALETHEKTHCKDPVHAVQVAKEEHAKECCDDVDHALVLGPKKPEREVKDGCETGQTHEGGCGGHDHSQGSLFFNLHRMLAVEQMRLVWSRSGGSLLGDGKQYDAKDLQVDTKTMGKEADKTASKEKERAKERGFAFAQEDNKAYLSQNPDAERLLNLVDQFVSHPEDSTRWCGIFATYVGANADHPARDRAHPRVGLPAEGACQRDLWA